MCCSQRLLEYIYYIVLIFEILIDLFLIYIIKSNLIEFTI